MEFVVPTEFFFVLSLVLFVLGALGVLLRKNAILVFMSVELMLNSANLALVAFARQWNSQGRCGVCAASDRSLQSHC